MATTVGESDNACVSPKNSDNGDLGLTCEIGSSLESPQLRRRFGGSPRDGHSEGACIGRNGLRALDTGYRLGPSWVCVWVSKAAPGSRGRRHPVEAGRSKKRLQREVGEVFTLRARTETPTCTRVRISPVGRAVRSERGQPFGIKQPLIHVAGQGHRTRYLRGLPIQPTIDHPGQYQHAVRHEPPDEPPRRPGHQA